MIEEEEHVFLNPRQGFTVMAKKKAISHAPALANGPGQTILSPAQRDSETEGLGSLVHALQEECGKLREALADVTAECDLYRKAVYASSRGAFHFEGVDIPALEKVSAGLVQILE